MGQLKRNGTNRVGFLDKGVDEDTQKLVSVVNFIGILADDPDERSLSLGLIQFV